VDYWNLYAGRTHAEHVINGRPAGLRRFGRARSSFAEEAAAQPPSRSDQHPRRTYPEERQPLMTINQPQSDHAETHLPATDHGEPRIETEPDAGLEADLAADTASDDIGTVDGVAGTDGRRTRRRGRKWLRRIAIAMAALIAAVTVFSFGYNAFTQDRMAVPSGLTYVQTGDINTRYRQWGTGGSPIVLVHGFIESADTWQYTAARLAAAGHRVYALDLDGFGYTQRVAPFDLEHQTTQLLDFLSALHLRRPVLVGHSSGAAIAAAAALRTPSAIGALMFLDGDGLNTGAGAKNPLTNLFINPYRTTLFRLIVRSDTLIRTIYSAACGRDCPRLDTAGIDQWRRPLQVPGAEAAMWAMAKLGVPGMSAKRVADVGRLGLPTSVVFGVADTEYPANSPAQTAARIGAPAPTIIRGAAHLTPVSSPSAVAEATLALAART
jgi:pimeloyl-ACP methyl ester carboxylesterase